MTTLRQSLSKYSTLDPIGQTNSASLASAERRIKELENDNDHLRRELADVQSLYTQLIHENKHEKFDERRVNLLKAQIIQLEKQVLLLNDGLTQRAEVLVEMENAIASIADCCRQFMGKKDRIGEVSVPYADMRNIVETAESTRLKLSKCTENVSSSNHIRRLVFTSPSLQKKDTSLLDICSGDLHHLNLRHVAKLESKLAQTYQQLTSLTHSLSAFATSPNPSVKEKKNQKKTDIAQANFIRLSGQASRLLGHLDGVLRDLLDLTVLVPAAPWPVLSRRGVSADISVDEVLRLLPALPRGKADAVRRTVDALTKAANYSAHMASLKLSAQQEELRFHQTVYTRLMQYSVSLMDALRVGYKKFEDDANQLLCDPLRAILGVYTSLKQTASEDALKHFLATFREHEADLTNAVTKLTPNADTESATDAALSEFGEDFLTSIELLREECAAKRDEIINQLDPIKEQNKHHQQQLRDYFLSSTSAADIAINDEDVSVTEKKPKATKRSNNRDDTGIKGWSSDIPIDVSPPHTKSDESVAGIISNRSNVSSKDWNFSTVLSRTPTPRLEPSDESVSVNDSNRGASSPPVPAQFKSVDIIIKDDVVPCTCGEDHDQSPRKQKPTVTKVTAAHSQSTDAGVVKSQMSKAPQMSKARQSRRDQTSTPKGVPMSKLVLKKKPKENKDNGPLEELSSNRKDGSSTPVKRHRSLDPVKMDQKSISGMNVHNKHKNTVNIDKTNPPNDIEVSNLERERTSSRLKSQRVDSPAMSDSRLESSPFPGYGGLNRSESLSSITSATRNSSRLDMGLGVADGGDGGKRRSGSSARGVHLDRLMPAVPFSRPGGAGSTAASPWR